MDWIQEWDSWPSYLVFFCLRFPEARIAATTAAIKATDETAAGGGGEREVLVMTDEPLLQRILFGNAFSKQLYPYNILSSHTYLANLQISLCPICNIYHL